MHQVQLSTDAPPFQQLVSMSGSPLMMRPLPGAVAEGIYQSVIDILGLHKLSAAERKSTLLSIPAVELLSKLPPGLPFLPVLDGDSIRDALSFSGLKSGLEVTRSHDMKLLIGSCDMDVRIPTSTMFFAGTALANMRIPGERLWVSSCVKAGWLSGKFHYCPQ